MRSYARAGSKAQSIQKPQVNVSFFKKFMRKKLKQIYAFFALLQAHLIDF